METNQKKLGIFAGEGKLPVQVAITAKEQGYEITGFALSKLAKDSLESYVNKIYEITPGQIGRNMNLVKESGVNEVVFIGKVPKLNLLKNIYKLDWIAIQELSKLTSFSDDNIQQAVAKLVENYGATIISQTKFLEKLFPSIGVLTQKAPSDEELADINYGIRIAKELARLDIGQTVIVKDLMILAIEAIEGTDEAIRRASHLTDKPPVVVKVARLNHDPRFDVPACGVNTLKAMIGKNKGGVLAVTANETMLVDKDEMIDFANEHQIAIIVM